MAAEEEFEDTLKLTTFALLMSGVNSHSKNWSSFKTSWVESLPFYLNMFLLHSGMAGEVYFTIDAISKGGNIIEHATMLPCMAICVLGTIKIVFLYKDNNIVLQIVNKLREIHVKTYNEFDLQNADTVESQIMKCGMKYLKRNIRIMVGLGICVGTMFLLAPVILMIVGYIQNGFLTYQLPYIVKYALVDVYQPPYWYIEYLHHIHATAVVFLNILGTDSFFYSFCSFLEIYFKLLCIKLEKLGSSSNVETRTDFAASVIRHQELINLADKAEVVYTYSMLFNIVISSLLICFSGFYMTVSEDFDICVTFFLFLLMSLSQIFLICYFADNLMQASTGVSQAVYKCKWYDFEESTKKGIFLILLRAQSPCKLTAANFTELNLNAFTTILSRSWSLFALLKTVYN